MSTIIEIGLMKLIERMLSSRKNEIEFTMVFQSGVILPRLRPVLLCTSGSLEGQQVGAYQR